LAPRLTQRTKDEKCKLTKLVIRIASGLRLKRVSRIDYVPLMVNGEYSSPVHLHFNGRLVPARKPKTINSLVLPDKVGSIDPEGWLLGGMAGDFHNREVVGIDPNFPLEQILVFAFRSGFENEAMIRPSFLLTDQQERVIRSCNRAVVMLPTGRSLALTLDQPVEHQVTHEP